MREVLYRGKRVDNGEWVYGYYYKIPAPPVCFKEDKKVVQVKHFIILEHPNYVPDWGMPRKMVQVEVDPETVGQCIGLPDKNGKKIYEGDFVAFEDGTSTEAGFMDFVSIGEVEWVKEIAGFTVSDRASADIECVFESCEVVGNKWDTPDLLNKTIGD